MGELALEEIAPFFVEQALGYSRDEGPTVRFHADFQQPIHEVLTGGRVVCLSTVVIHAGFRHTVGQNAGRP